MTTSELLTALQTAKANLITQISTGGSPVLEYEIRGKKVKFVDHLKMLEALNAEISQCLLELDRAAGKRPRNRARTRR
ncbi:hypothetical protein LOC67_23425 [Stieleria sp. JC731]|uniref:hypothetical protein n=1 Tax=Pirellulaceae TaxID=2691357 RepID=UPI001E44315A|nr:hypothetical protein [Stieleria sp. JC731]MCC9603511.1 hypothetical protein [Stieleria sp. JC731]